ncbi:MAG TPA: hypothetical protein VK526_06415 [Bradyrhizobium sp.]|nr:hypothetical protein [Bradyrhizobium sp.]
MKLASSGSRRCARARGQKFFRRKRDAVGVGVIQQAAMVGLRNQAAGAAQRYGADNAVPAIPATLASPPSFLMMVVAGFIFIISDIPK